jgi:hypothetical protein
MVFGAAALTSSILFVDNVLKMKMQPIAPAAIPNIKINNSDSKTSKKTESKEIHG